jgi:hypothetical protein
MHLKKGLSRRAFLKAGALATLGWAAGCAAPSPVHKETAQQPPTANPTNMAVPADTPAPTSTPVLTATPAPTDTPEPTATATLAPTSTATVTAAVAPTSTLEPTQAPSATNTPAAEATPLVARPAREDLISHYPQTPSSVVSLVQHEGVWNGDQILSTVVLQMLDAALTQLTGINDAAAAWGALFDPGEVIGIKVNTISRYTTSPEVAYAVAQRLEEAGIPAGQIVLFDRSDWELQTRGYTLNADGPGVRCRGARAWEQPEQVAGTTQRVHDVMLGCDALINLPALKQHGTSGFTSAMKNHYGTIDAPGRLHGGQCDPGIPELNALSVIRDKTRLVIGDFLRSCPYNWNRMTKENLIAMSFDPVAFDGVARQVLVDRRAADDRSASDITGMSHYVESAVKMGLGADNTHTEVVKAILG